MQSTKRMIDAQARRRAGDEVLRRLERYRAGAPLLVSDEDLELQQELCGGAGLVGKLGQPRAGEGAPCGYGFTCRACSSECRDRVEEFDRCEWLVENVRSVLTELLCDEEPLPDDGEAVSRLQREAITAVRESVSTLVKALQGEPISSAVIDLEAALNKALPGGRLNQYAGGINVRSLDERCRQVLAPVVGPQLESLRLFDEALAGILSPKSAGARPRDDLAAAAARRLGDLCAEGKSRAERCAFFAHALGLLGQADAVPSLLEEKLAGRDFIAKVYPR